jgi:hypothetical protein
MRILILTLVWVAVTAGAPAATAAAAAAPAAGAPAAAPAAAPPATAPPGSAPSTSSTSSISSASPAAAPAGPGARSAAGDPWGWLTRVRRSLVAAGPTAARFTQSYIPAGFTSGETETGSLSLRLPDCLRWDYQDPYPKGFLLCGELVQAWNPEDHTGRRYHVERKNEPGLDLLLLGVDDLQQRYSAATRKSPGGQVEIALAPRSQQGQLTDATLAIDPATLRIVEVSYHDREGNLTRFQIAGYHALSAGGQFKPPAGIHWEDQP